MYVWLSKKVWTIFVMNHRVSIYQITTLKLPSLFTAWLFWTFYIKSHNMKALSHSWSPFLPLIPTYSFIWKNEHSVGLCAAFWSIFLRNKLHPEYSCQTRDHDHQWADLVMAWLLWDKRKCEHNDVKLESVYILLSKWQCVHIALAINRPDILLM